MKIDYIKTSAIKPFERNAKKHDETQIANVVESIKQFGFAQPLVVDRDNVLIIGHCRLLAAKRLKLKEVPVLRMDELTEEQVNKLRLLDNKLNESDWDFDLLLDDIPALDFSDFEIDWGFPDDWFSREKEGTARQEGNDEYNEFLEKFEQKKTTDDCYTPDNIYEAVADWVAKEYNLNRSDFVRPFYPNGDYQKEKYKKGAVVVDNPPFSILVEIERWYNDHGIKYFLFAPHVSNFPSERRCCAVGVGCPITYENGAEVLTSFVTNLEDLAARTAPDLHSIIAEINTMNTKGREIPKYDYPPNVLTAAMLSYLSKYGQEFKLEHSEATAKIGALDAQKKEGKGIFGGGFLISDEAAARKKAAEEAVVKKVKEEKHIEWTLSEREKKIIAKLGKGKS